MQCPACRQDNIEGTEFCADCGADLSALFADGEDDVASGLLTDTLAKLKPAKPISLTPTATVADAIEIMRERSVGCVLVAEDERLLGVFTERDALRKVANQTADVWQTPLGEFMTKDPESLAADAPIGFAVNLMAVGGYRHVPIVEDGKLTGIVSVRDVMSYVSKLCLDIHADN